MQRIRHFYCPTLGHGTVSDNKNDVYYLVTKFIPTHKYLVEGFEHSSELLVQNLFPQRILTLSIFSDALGRRIFLNIVLPQ